MVAEDLTVADDDRIRVLLADDNLIARNGVASLLATDPGIEVVGKAEDGAAAIKLYRELAPDVVVTDLKMPKLDGIQVTQALAAEQPPGAVLVLSQFEGDEGVVRALQAGALGYVTKEVDGDELIRAVRSVAARERYLPRAIANKLAERLVHSALSPRELQVLQLVYGGQSNREIAAALRMSERTVSVHVSNILDKLDARNRTEAVRIALERGLL